MVIFYNFSFFLFNGIDIWKDNDNDSDHADADG